MFCKHCGKEIADDSSFCQYCGGKQDFNNYQESPSNQQNNDKVKVEIGDELKATIAPILPKLTWLQYCKEHSAIVLIYAVWLIINILFLINGDGEQGFWPHIHSHRELIWNRDWLGNSTGVGHYGPKEWVCDWDIDLYGWSEFIVYVTLVPILFYIIYRLCLITPTKNGDIAEAVNATKNDGITEVNDPTNNDDKLKNAAIIGLIVLAVIGLAVPVFRIVTCIYSAL